ncbi:MAG: hypothetical protein IJT74_08130 [Bacteroidales bacterium]|nr:hypothetical protein [Bacteroidales bacterium]
MKKINIVIAALAVMMAGVSCNKEQNVPENPVGPEGKTVTINASIPEELTKVALGYTGSALALTWQEGDQIIVSDHSNPGNKQTFTLASGEGTKNAKFTGTAVSASSFDIQLISNMPSAAGMLSQTQAADGSTAHLGYSATLSGVSSYEDVAFTQAWATSKGGTFTQSGALHVSVTLPNGVAAKVNKVTMKADQDIFGAAGGTMVVNITNPGDTGSDNTFDVFATIPTTGVLLPKDLGILFKFGTTDANHVVYTRYYQTPSALTLAPGQLNLISLTGTNSDKYAGKDDDGSAEHPYLIADKYQLDSMHTLMVDKETKYFKMVADVDLDGIAWTSLNNSGKFEKGINFDGDGHTISNLKCSSGAYPSFAGVINGVVKNVVFDKATITAGNNTSGILAGYIGSSSSSISGACSGVTVKNSSVESATKTRVGGIAGYANVVTGTISNCHVINTTLESTNERVGGLIGQTDVGILVEDCSAESVTVSGSINIGGLIGCCYGDVVRSSSSGVASSVNTAKDTDIAVGGLVGFLQNGSISKCHSSVSINQTNNGRDIGGLIGKMVTGTVEKSYATGNVSGIQRNVGGLIGLITHTSDTATATVRDCYSTGNVSANSYNGGFLGLHEKGTVMIENCYSSGSVSATAFAAGGFIGVCAAGLSLSKSAAWSGSVSAGNKAAGNWSSGAVVGVTFPKCTITDCYRYPSMSLEVYWVPAADYNHPDVSSSHPLVKQDGTETTATSTSKGQDGYPQFPYHGKVEAGKTLSELASTTLGWSSSVWDFSTALPTLK